MHKQDHALRLVPVILHVALGAKPGTLSGPGRREAAVGPCRGSLLPQAVPLPLVDEVPPCHLGTGLWGLLASITAGPCPQHLPGMQDWDAGALTLAVTPHPTASPSSQ